MIPCSNEQIVKLLNLHKEWWDAAPVRQDPLNYKMKELSKYATTPTTYVHQKGNMKWVICLASKIVEKDIKKQKTQSTSSITSIDTVQNQHKVNEPNDR